MTLIPLLLVKDESEPEAKKSRVSFLIQSGRQNKRKRKKRQVSDDQNQERDSLLLVFFFNDIQKAFFTGTTREKNTGIRMKHHHVDEAAGQKIETNAFYRKF